MSYKDKKTILMEKKAKRLAHMGVQYLGGTISPAKAIYNGDHCYELESLIRALVHYADRGYSEVMLQEKYMGSRGTATIYPDIDKCYMTSRGGYRINTPAEAKALTEKYGRPHDGIDFSAEYQKRINFYNSLYGLGNWDYIVEDGEILPWGLLGGNLTKAQYDDYLNLRSSFANNLLEQGFYDQNLDQLPKGVVPLVLGRALGTQFIKNTTSMRELVEGFQNQAMRYQPFNILKIVANGESRVVVDDNYQNTEILGNVNHVVVNVEQFKDLNVNAIDNLEEAYHHLVPEEVQSMIVDIESRKGEGVMVKPLKYLTSEESGHQAAAPMLKVRNLTYLAISYGADIVSETDQVKVMAEKKQFQHKVPESLKQYRLAKRLLTFTESERVASNADYQRTILDFLKCDADVAELDPRL